MEYNILLQSNLFDVCQFRKKLAFKHNETLVSLNTYEIYSAFSMK